MAKTIKKKTNNLQENLDNNINSNNQNINHNVKKQGLGPNTKR